MNKEQLAYRMKALEHTIDVCAYKMYHKYNVFVEAFPYEGDRVSMPDPMKATHDKHPMVIEGMNFIFWVPKIVMQAINSGFKQDRTFGLMHRYCRLNVEHRDTKRQHRRAEEGELQEQVLQWTT